MPKYLLAANYVGEGVQGLLKDGGTARRATVEKLVASVGGKVEAFYYALGDVDLYIIIDAPDNASVVAAALTAVSSGSVRIKTTALLAPEEIDAASKLSPSYRAPGS